MSRKSLLAVLLFVIPTILIAVPSSVVAVTGITFTLDPNISDSDGGSCSDDSWLMGTYDQTGGISSELSCANKYQSDDDGVWRGLVQNPVGSWADGPYAGASICEGATHPLVNNPQTVRCGSPKTFTPMKTIAANGLRVNIIGKILSRGLYPGHELDGQVNFGIWMWFETVDGYCVYVSSTECYKKLELALAQSCDGAICPDPVGTYFDRKLDQDPANGIYDYWYRLRWVDFYDPGESFNLDYSVNQFMDGIFSGLWPTENLKLSWAGYYIEAAGAWGEMTIDRLDFYMNTNAAPIPSTVTLVSDSRYVPGACDLVQSISSSTDFNRYSIWARKEGTSNWVFKGDYYYRSQQNFMVASLTIGSRWYFKVVTWDDMWLSSTSNEDKNCIPA